MQIRYSFLALTVPALLLAGCKSASAPATPPQAMQAMPVHTQTIALNPVPNGDIYVSTIKSRRSATMQPQIDGNITSIRVKSGDHVRSGQLLMTIDPLKQQATVASQQGTEAQKKAVYDYAKIELDRQKQLFESGVTSRDAYDNAIQAYNNSKGDYEAQSSLTGTQKEQLAYYQIRAPFDGIVGDIPVHQGDYVSPTTVLTTVDEPSQLEAYIYVPTERASQVKLGLPVDILNTDGSTITRSSIYFLSPQVDNGLQSILAKAPVPSNSNLRNLQIVKARVVWSTAPTATVPVLAVTRIGGQAFVYIAAQQGDGYVVKQVPVTLGDAIGNNYPVIAGLKPGDRVIDSGLQFIGDGMPVKPLS